MKFIIEKYTEVGDIMNELSRKQENGDWIFIKVKFDNGRFKISDVGCKAKGKRKKVWCNDLLHNDYDFRLSRGTMRQKIILDNYLTVTDIETLNQALKLVWRESEPAPLVLDDYMEQ